MGQQEIIGILGVIVLSFLLYQAFFNNGLSEITKKHS